MKRVLLSFATICALASASHAAQPTGKMTKAERAASQATAEQASFHVSEKGFGELDQVIWLSTEPFLQYRYASDKFWRAMIDKETGKVIYQIYLKLQSPNSMRLSKLTYVVDGKLKSVPLERVSFDVSCQRYGCTHYEDFIGDFPREDMEALAKGADASDIVTRLKVFGDSVSGIETEVFRNEIGGLLIATDRRLEEMAKNQAK